ncbi:AraC family transcriptional regulator [Acidisoma cellulosilytica]|uniref:AraC family transcriptional regulator n=1 Tax=Acidisoma cellulosilyticum TaxID=2802395 RepID=A0A963Z541_9PROT|nr:AraC family transcriptional regulator [Acidisoma cellulosilyticum]MCB8882979.1 AraC family transcriptional regulator [Acidisoma cellulosilyticum]
MTDTLEDLTDLPKTSDPTPDLLSHVLGQIRLTGDRIRSLALAPRDRLDLPAEEAHLCVVTDGRLHIAGGEQGLLVVSAGDLMMFPRGPGQLQLAARDASASVVLCRFRFDTDSLRDMMSALPRCIHIGRAEGAGWLDGIVHFLLLEASDEQPGAALMVSRLIDLAVIRTLRSWIHRGPISGWFGGLTDPRIANVLKAIHERPMQRWSIDALASIAGMSRSSFCERFTTLVGRPPLRYHNEHRLALARDLLTKRGARVGEIGLSIGYESEAAFSRAYKSLFGHSPRTEYKYDEADRHKMQ